MQNRNKYLFYFLLSLSSFLFSDNKEFIKSFVDHYEFNAEGRYAHEYHPVLLEKTSHSLDELEQNLADNNFNLAGRMIISGYEENAVPSYYTDYKKAKINDEASSKNNVGWSLRLHNRFGFMTGFLFKDINFYHDYWFKNQDAFFKHIDNEDVEIFNDKAVIFQDHAFGEALPYVLNAQRKVIRNFKQKDFKKVFQELISFWNSMYKGEIKVGNKQIAGTQDILFSIEYAKHLVRSELPLYTCFFGPDITYPIEVSVSQPKDATIHAQNFVKFFSTKLNPLNNQKTVYIFCSFVDGVGKSTLLGNVKNYLKYGADVESFERVDNSSSQLAELFKLKDDVFIADLPAQVSHFTYKPDGFVYVDVARDLDEQQIEEVRKFVRINQEELKNNYTKSISKIKNIIDKDSYFSKEFNDIKNPVSVFIKNLFLLKRVKENRWIPFVYNNQNYLFNFYDITNIRILTPLGLVQSEGLKNIEIEQMLFFDGIRLPIAYEYFLNDLVSKLKNNEIQNIVFVDFISMYPRSSRENIRINYLLQQMALLQKSFDPRFSLYKDFVNDAELFALLKKNKSFKKISSSFNLEILSRLALFNLIIKRKEDNLDGLNFKELTGMIQQELQLVTQEDKSFLEKLAYKKLNHETAKLEELYGLTKIFVNVQQFSFKKLVFFAEQMRNFYANVIDNNILNELWQDPGEISDIEPNFDNGYLDKVYKTDKNIPVRVLYKFDLKCKDRRTLTPFLRTMRAVFYAMCLNVFHANNFCGEFLVIKKPKYDIPPIYLKIGKDKKVYLLQRIFDKCEEDVKKAAKLLAWSFNLDLNKSVWGIHQNIPYCLDWNANATNVNLFAYSCKLANTNAYSYNKSIVTFLVQKYKKEFGREMIMPTSKLYEELCLSKMWKSEWKKMFKKAKKHGEKKKKDKEDKSDKDIKETDDKNNQDKNKKTDKDKKNSDKINEDDEEFTKDKKDKKLYFAKNGRKEINQLFIRMLSTLEMVIKDPDGDIALRVNDREDFAASLKLFEKVVLPKYLGRIFQHNLFDDYEYVEPFPSWDEWEVK